MTADSPSELDVEQIVKDRYATGAHQQVEALCCPVNYDPKFLEVIPQEVIERDYGCGDPSRYLKPGETVLDLGSGTGKICFIAAQVVGSEGKVIGVDMTHDMLNVARRNAPIVAERIGFSNVEFKRGRIQDLGLDLDAVDEVLSTNPVNSADDMFRLQQEANDLRRTSPLIANDTIDVVVSNCVLNLVAATEKPELFRELHRVLRNGGRAVISDIVSDEEIPLEMQQDADLWSGCISGALTETGFIQAFEDAGFFGIRLLEREHEPWQTVQGIEFRSVVIEAHKGKVGPCMEHNQAVIYKGPFREVLDDDGHRLVRGDRMAVCNKTFNLYQGSVYDGQFEFIEPRIAVRSENAQPFDRTRSARRHPEETKGSGCEAPAGATTESTTSCTTSACC